MILSKEIITGISHLNIEYYKSLGYDAKCNNKLKVLVEHLPKESNLKVLVKCDVCGYEKWINYQKYTRNISKYNLYTCNSVCSRIKVMKTNKEKYGDENYVNTEELKKTVKIKYDKITEDIEKRGYICCIKCNVEKNLSDYLVKGGRYKHICRLCRNDKFYINRNKKPHVKAWRSILRGYLLRKNVKKTDKTLLLLGYSPEELRLHISKLFDKTMNWDNYGEWHIDHIIHVSFFKDDTPVFIANSLDNLRPLKSIDNMIRHNNVDNDCINLINKYKTYIKEKYIN